MIYLIQSAYIDDNDNFHKALKIGYAKDLDKRLIAYYTHSPNIKLLDSREGDEELEKYLHKYFNKYSIKCLHSREWFIYNDEIINSFSTLKKEFLEELYGIKKLKTINEYLLELENKDSNLSKEIKSFLKEFEKDQNFIRRMKLYCEYADKNDNSFLLNFPIPEKFHIYYNLGSAKLKALNYQESRIIEEISNNSKLSSINIDNLGVSLGEKYSKHELKKILQKFYDSNGIKKTAKASDINQYYETKRAKIPTGITGKYDEGLELIKIKDNLL